MALHTTMYILLVILAPVIHSTAETIELVLKESEEHCQKSDECSSGRCVPDFTQVMPINLDFEGVIHHQIVHKCAICTINSHCQKNQYCSKFKCHNNSKPTTTTAEPTPEEPSLATLQQLLTKLTQNQQKNHEQLIEKHEQLHHLLTLPFCPDIVDDSDAQIVNVGSNIGTQVGGGGEVNKVVANPLEKQANEKSEKNSPKLQPTPGVDCQPRPNSGAGGITNVGNDVEFQNVDTTVGAQCTGDATCTVNIFQG